MSVVSLTTLLLPGPSCLRLTDISTSDAGISLDLTATRGAVACPSCSVESEHVHTLYQRTVADLPWASVPVTLHLHVRRFVCRHPACPRATFSEPLPEVVAPSARRSLSRPTNSSRAPLLPHPVMMTRRTHPCRCRISSARDPYRQQVQEQRRERRLAQYEQVLALHHAGALQQAIAERRNITRATVSRYLKATRFPERGPYPRLESKLDPYNAYLSKRWAAGETTGRHLWQELQSQGFEGALMTVMRWAARQQLLVPAPPTSRRGRNQQARGAQPEQAVAPLRTRRVAWWLLRRPDTLSTGHQAVLARMEHASPAFGQLYRRTVQFTEMLRKRQVEQLRPWLDAAQASDLRELKSLAEGMERDYGAVEAALRLPSSTGPVEGNINRLKLIKRSGYGRAGFDLLRLRVLAT